MKTLAQRVNTAAQDSNPGPLNRQSEALPVSHCSLCIWLSSSLSITPSASLPLCISLPLCLCIYACVSICEYLSVFLYHVFLPLSICVGICVSLSRCLTLSFIYWDCPFVYTVYIPMPARKIKSTCNIIRKSIQMNNSITV